MSSHYRKKLSQQLRAELERLRVGNVHERQRFENALDAINRVMENPLDRNYSKNLPENYKAVDVLQQYRLFFKLVHPPTASRVTVYFQWMNDEDSIHETGSPDDCYEVFRRMAEKGELEPFKEDEESRSGYFRRNEWGENTVYVEYHEESESDTAHANSFLMLARGKSGEYRIQHITPSVEGRDLPLALLRALTTDADTQKIHLVYERLSQASFTAEHSRALEQCGFVITEEIEGEQIWERSAR